MQRLFRRFPTGCSARHAPLDGAASDDGSPTVIARPISSPDALKK